MAEAVLLLIFGMQGNGHPLALGACDRLTRQTLKSREFSVFLAFPRFSAAVCFGKKLLTTDLTTYGFDRKNRISGCRVTVTHQFWELAQAGSTPVIPTKNQSKMRFFAPLSADFFAYNWLLSTTSANSPGSTVTSLRPAAFACASVKVPVRGG